MTTRQQWDHLIGLTATDADGGKIGNVGQVYLDENSGEPAWATVSTGMFGTRESFAPLYGSSVRDGQLVLAVSKQLVKDAPSIANDGHLSDAEVTALYQHYARLPRVRRSGRHGGRGHRRLRGPPHRRRSGRRRD